MDIKPDKIHETVNYEPGSLFLFHQNYRTDIYPDHWHDAIEIIMPIQGGYKIEINHQPFYLAERDVLIIPSDELHSLHPTDENGQRVILQFSLESLNAIRGFINASHIYSETQVITAKSDPDLHSAVEILLLKMLDEFLSRNVYFEVSITNKIVDLTLCLARKHKAESEAQYKNLVKRKGHVERLNECLTFIDRRCNENLTLEITADFSGFSKFHFARWFREYSGFTFHEFLTKSRVDKAEAMLLSTSRPVSEIALEAGFQSTSTFNRAFKKLKECTPQEYRFLHYLEQRSYSAGETENAYRAAITMKTPVPAGIRPPPNAENRTNGAAPSLWADIPDPDVIRVGDVYYMISTTMYFCPGIPVMKSRDLRNWEIVNYVYDILDDSDACALRNGASAYGKGSWAGTLRYHNGVFYVAAASFTTGKTYIFQTEDIENGAWRRFEIDGVFHDPSMLFDDDGRVYLVYGAGTIRIIELTPAADAILQNGLNRVIIEKADAGGDSGLPAEGSHLYKIDGRYYLFLIAWPAAGSNRRIELCYRTGHIEGPYEGRVVLDCGPGHKNNGLAQGGIFDTPDGKWAAMLFQDRGAVGRVPFLLPVSWADNWPVFGLKGRDLSVAAPAGIIMSDEFYPSRFARDFSARNGTGYRYRHIGELSGAESMTDTELLVNGHFTDGLNHWDVMEVAEIAITDDETFEGTPVLFVSERGTTASSPRQFITGKVKPDDVLEVRAYVLYKSGPSRKEFNISIRNGSSWEGIDIMGTGMVKKGEWGLVKGVYTLPGGADLSETSIFVETPWVEKPKKDSDIMDFYVGYVSAVSKALPRNTAPMPGENDPSETRLPLPWQWNHNPDHNLWTLTERSGYLRLKSKYLCSGLTDARNTLTQRTFGPACAAAAALETDGMNDGDTAGLAALQELYGYVGVKVVNGVKSIVAVSAVTGQAREIESVPVQQDRVYLRADFRFDDADTAVFFYSLDELNWHPIGEPLQMRYKLSHFTGYRFALFYFSTQIAGGHADFDYFRLCDTPPRSDEGLTVLNASLDGDAEIVGVIRAETEIAVRMDALPAGVYEGIYFSMPIPEAFRVTDVIFHSDNITGSAVYEADGNQLRLSVTGENVGFGNNTSDVFAVLKLSLNDYAAEDTVIHLRPDHLYVRGGNAAYRIHGARAAITVTAPGTGAAAKIPGYANPLVSHTYGADPWAMEYDGRVYLYLTGDSYEYDEFGRLTDNTYGKINTIQMISSSDLINWTDHGLITAAGANGAAKWAEHSWAPAVACKEGKFFLYFANDASNIGVLTADTPTGPWADPVGGPLIHRAVPGVKDVTWCFDPAVLVDDDGSAYLYFGGGLPSVSPEDVLHPRTARVIRLGADMISTVGEAVAIDAPALFEDSGIHKHNGTYIYSYCSNFEKPRTAGYPLYGEIAYMTAGHPMGPFTYAGTFLKNPSEFFGVGGNNHHCVFTFRGQDYVAYHAQTLGKALGRAKGYRSPHINRLAYYGDGTIQPVTADRKGVALWEPVNPYRLSEAVTFAWCSGINAEDGVITHIHDGDWLAVANVDFGADGASRFRANILSRAGGKIEIKLDSPTGEVLGFLGTGTSSPGSSWEFRSCEITPVTGVRNVFFVFSGDGDGDLFRFKSWQFDQNK
ncbi:MAG: family 43 glycosylhydrolase [Oscillospiraceae bacterium]|jgi:arabinoxylan arabinofuranohydrolase|nr:family 43 glycosylhydrolase [Oscillospiraceae bacterium]